MTALATGSTATASVGDGGSISIATNGGIGSVAITPIVGSATSENFGPLPHRKIYGPFAEGGSVLISNATCASLDYDLPAPGLTGSQVTAVQALMSGAAITADDTGSTWTLCPALLSFSATLTAGSSTTVLLEVRDSAGTVTTAATIVADTLTTQTLRQAFLTREAYEYRFRRSSGTGTVVIYL